ncbi:MAG: ParA family protein [Thermodesulfobacteriota bacterium]
MAPGVFSFINCKGGVGKTAVSVNVAAILAHSRFGQRVLLLDMDPQCSATKWVMGDAECVERMDNENHKTVYQLFHDAAYGTDSFDFDEAVLKTPKAVRGTSINLNLLPGSRNLRNVEDMLWQRAVNLSYPVTQILIKKLRPYLSNYDIVIVDCPPNTFRVTQNALAMSTHVLVPVMPDSLSLSGFEDLVRSLYDLGGSVGKGRAVPIAGIIVNQFRRNLIECVQGMAQVSVSLMNLKNQGRISPSCRIFRSPIPISTACPTAARACRPVFLLKGEGPEALGKGYYGVAKELLELI